MDIHNWFMEIHNWFAWQWAETIVEIKGTLADISETTK